jgi:hypothetical protein
VSFIEANPSQDLVSGIAASGIGVQESGATIGAEFGEAFVTEFDKESGIALTQSSKPP